MRNGSLGEVKSLCNTARLIDEKTDLCIECLKTDDEITHWSLHSGKEKLWLLEEIERREIPISL